MDPWKKERLVEAANALIELPDAGDLYAALIQTHEHAAKGLPIRLSGHASVLNPLLEFMLEDFDASETIFDLVEKKRSEGGLQPLRPLFDRKAYMRELMAKRRKRLNHVTELTNALRSEMDKIAGASRARLESAHTQRWTNYRLGLENQKRLSLGRRLTKDERTDIIISAWKTIDAELDAFEHFVKDQLRKPVLDRSEFVFRLGN